MPMRGENWRFWAPVAILALFAAYCAQKLIRAHVDPEVSSLTYEFERDVSGCRGSIYSAGGEYYPLAKSVPVWEYRLDPVAMTNSPSFKRSREEVAKTIASALSLSYDKVLEMTKDTAHRYQFLAISSDDDAHRIICDSKAVRGVKIEDRQVRQYLHGKLLSHVLGYVNAEGVGSAGLELKYDKDLAGVPGKIRGMRDAIGHEIYEKRIETIPPVPGVGIHLTIDHNIQYEVETMLASGVKEFGAAAGWCVALDARTGAVLAMASCPTFDPARYNREPDGNKMNRVIGFNYEPGSVMKVITAAAAIDCGLVKPDTMYSTDRDDERYYRLPGDGHHVWEPKMSVKDAIAKSSNIVIGKVGYDLGPQRLWSYMRRFGFGEKTGIELPGEEYGILPRWDRWDKVKWSRAPIGQGVSVTPLQLASAYQAIANDGIRMQPYIIDREVASDGRVIFKHSPTPIGRVISVATARKVKAMMLGVASKTGTAKRAAIRGYSVAGKTGTAQKVINGHYADQLFYATFCGIVPASDPRIVVLVTLDFDEKRQFHQGGNSSALIFRRISTALLRFLRIPPDKPDEVMEDDSEDEYDRIMDERVKNSDSADD